jgi:hypothetical protein
MTESGSVAVRHQVILVARILLAALFLLFGREELTSYSG